MYRLASLTYAHSPLAVMGFRTGMLNVFAIY